MGKIYPAEKPLSSGLPITPHEINEELQTIIGEFNGRIDRDNLDQGSMLGAKFAKECLTSYNYDGTAVPIIQTSEGLPVGTMLAVPQTAVGTDQVSFEIDTTDGALIVEGSMTVLTQGPEYVITNEDPPQWTFDPATLVPYNYPWSLVVTVDGRVVAESGMSGGYPKSSRHVKQYVPVGAGKHTVALWLRVGASGRTLASIQRAIVVLPVTYFYGPRNLFARHIKR